MQLLFLNNGNVAFVGWEGKGLGVRGLATRALRGAEAPVECSLRSRLSVLRTVEKRLKPYFTTNY